YPSTNSIWPQFKSPLMWDVFAVSTYFTTSLLFWYIGLIPDLASLRDASHSRRARRVYGVFALGWRGSARHWHHYKIAYLLLAGLATPLVLSVWYNGNPFEEHVFFVTRPRGPFAWAYFTQMFCNVVVPQMFWFRWARRNVWTLWVGSVLVNVGMWFERFNIIITSLHQDFIPSNWAMYYPTWVDFSLLFGTICFFGTLFLVFLKFIPAVA